MSYTVTMMDKTEYFVTLEEGEAIKELWLDPKGQRIFQINDDQYLINSIKSVKKTIERIVPTVDDDHRLPEPNRCRGKNSIQREITMIIVKKYGKDWTKYAADKQLRERIRSYLRSKSTTWCDNHDNLCVCDVEFQPEKVNFAEVFNIFPGAKVI
jgi:hypothetical protein